MTMPTFEGFPASPVDITPPRVNVSSIKYDIVGYHEIPVKDIRPHPDNPRPVFHTADDDPNLLELGDSIRTTGQHRPAYVFQIKDHYSLPDEPGQYMLLQGERRWRACRITGVETLRCLVVATPSSKAEEQVWLGVEESYKQDWQQFFVLRFAYNLAQAMGVPVTSLEITSRTGLKKDDLKKAQKLFSLHPDVQKLVQEYEETVYLSRINHPNAKRISGGTGVRAKEFTVAKAVLVWDVFEALRANIPTLVNGHSDQELQLKLARWTTKTKSSTEDIERFLTQVKSFATVEIPPGFPASLHNILEGTSNVTMRQLVAATGGRAAVRHSKLVRQAARLLPKLELSMKDVNQIGRDPEQIRRDSRTIYEVGRALDDYERQVIAPTLFRLDPDGDRNG